MLVPGWGKGSFDDLSRLAIITIAVHSHNGKWVWETKDLSLDEPVGCYNYKKENKVSKRLKATAK
jgi:hypothetical protein